VTSRLARWALAAGCAAIGAWGLGMGQAAARATFVITNGDPAGVGFNDPTPAEPVGGNSGTTLGRQRQIAFQFAADIWGAALDSPVPIVVAAQFSPLACGNSIIALGNAHAASAVASVPPQNTIPGLPSNVFFPQPLADRLAGVDLDPGQPDILATFNGGLHECDDSLDWYYGLDGNAGSNSDLVEVVVHELGHGLGFSSNADPATGAFQRGIPDAFSSHLFDNTAGRSWLDMTDAQRLASMKNVRHLVWVGDNVKAATARVLALGAPLLSVVPVLAGLAGNLGETNFGPLVAAGNARGSVVLGSPVSGCSALQSHPGAIFLLSGDSPCSPLNQADYATRAGAIALLLTDSNNFAPPSSLELPPAQLKVIPITIPVVTISYADGQLLASSAGQALDLSLSGQSNRLTGADAYGRPYLYASDPVRAGSTVSHWDPLARPDLVEEPESGYQHPHDITMEAAVLRDIGWIPLCGNGALDTGEDCDDGAANDDTKPNACRTDCTAAGCGDGVTDSGEACDLGAQNGTTGAACSATCTVVATTTPTPPPPAAACVCGVSSGDGAPTATGAGLLLILLGWVVAARPSAHQRRRQGRGRRQRKR
jgi:hypothetical protein